MSSDTTIAGDVLNQQTHLAYKRMVKKKGVGIPCHFSKVCIFDLFSFYFTVGGSELCEFVSLSSSKKLRSYVGLSYILYIRECRASFFYYSYVKNHEICTELAGSLF